MITSNSEVHHSPLLIHLCQLEITLSLGLDIFYGYRKMEKKIQKDLQIMSQKYSVATNEIVNS